MKWLTNLNRNADQKDISLKKPGSIFKLEKNFLFLNFFVDIN